MCQILNQRNTDGSTHSERRQIFEEALLSYGARREEAARAARREFEAESDLPTNRPMSPLFRRRLR